MNSSAPEPLTFDPALQALIDPYLPPLSSPASVTPPPLPHLTLTYATSLDSQISLSPGTRTLLSGPASKAMTHYLRSRHDAILIGVNTMLADNPSLNCRFSENGTDIVGISRQPIPLILDPRCTWEVRGDEKVFEMAEKGLGRAPWWLTHEDHQLPPANARALSPAPREVANATAGLSEEAFRAKEQEKLKRLLDAGGSKMYVWSHEANEPSVNWQGLLKSLAVNGVRSVMVEGGAKVIEDLLRERNQKYVSSVVVTVAPTFLGKGGVGVCPERGERDRATGRLRDVRWVPLGEDVVIAGRLGVGGV